MLPERAVRPATGARLLRPVNGTPVFQWPESLPLSFPLRAPGGTSLPGPERSSISNRDGAAASGPVGGSGSRRPGVVAAASYEVRRLGVKLSEGDVAFLANSISYVGDDAGFKGRILTALCGIRDAARSRRLQTVLRQLDEAELLWLCGNHSDIARHK